MKTHNEIFELLQSEYILARDIEKNQVKASRILGKMYEVILRISKNYIVKYARARGLRLDLEELSHVSALYIIEQYLKKPAFRVNRLSAYAHFGCIKALSKDMDKDKNEVSYEELFEKWEDDTN
jgi:hypothetical protein